MPASSKKTIAPNRYPGHAGRNRTAHHPFLERDIGPDRRTFLSDRYHHLYIIQPVPLPQAWRRRAEPGARRTTGALDCRYAGHRRGASCIGFCFPIIGGQCDFHCQRTRGERSGYRTYDRRRRNKYAGVGNIHRCRL